MSKQNLMDKVSKAELKVEKTQNTLLKHEKQLEKKLMALVERGVDASNLDDFKWTETGTSTEFYWDICDIERKRNDIESTKNKLEDAKRIHSNWHKKLDVEVEKERFLNDEAPQVILDFLEQWKQLAYDWHIKRYDAYKAFQKELEEEVRNAYKEIGIQEGHFPNIEQEKELKSRKLDYKTVKKRRDNFAGKAVLYMDTIRDKKKRDTWLTSELEKERKAKLLDLIQRINEVVGSIQNANDLSISSEGNLNGNIVGERASARVETVGAGGYNIQCFHYRTLVHRL